MGAFFDQIRNKRITVDKQLLNASGSKLRQYFCSFRSICEDFTIRTRQYMQIFGSNVKSFQVWDPDRRGLIDAMEMFSGLIIFSKVSYQDKIRFLYQIFDLNQQGFLEYDQLVYLFINICEATCKIYQIQSSSLNNQIIEQYLDEFFSQETQLKYEDFLRWSYRTEEIIQFFEIIGHPFQPQTNTHSIDEYDQTNLNSKRVPHPGAFNCKRQNKLKVKIDERFLNIIKNDHILLQDEQKQHEFNPVMNWVYGIRVDDIRYPLHYRKTQLYKAANQKFIYICGKNVVVLYPKLNKQKNYTHHQKPVSYVQISSCEKVVASGEMGLYPSIHIWHLKTAKCIQKFDKIHKNSVKMLKFLQGNELLVTIGQKYSSSLVILNINTKQKILSTYLAEPVLNIIELRPEKPGLNYFYIALPSFLVECSSQNTGYSLKYNKISALCPGKEKQVRLKTANSFILNQRQMVMAVDESNSIYVYDHLTNELHQITIPIQKANNDKSIGNETERVNQNEKIVDIYPSKLKNRFYILHTKHFTLIELDERLNVKFRNLPVMIPPTLFNLELVQLIQVNDNCVIVVSLMGDVIKVTNFIHQSIVDKQTKRTGSEKDQQPLESIKIINQSNDYNETDNEIEEKVELNVEFHKYCQIFKMEKINGVCFLSKQVYQPNSQFQKPRLVVASNSLIYIIDQVGKQLLSLQCLQQNITHIHSVNNTYAVATQSKYLMVLRDGITVEKTKCTDTANNPDAVINGFKITAESLIVAIDLEIFIYCKSGGNYLDRESKKIKIDHGIPIHLSMTSIPKVFLVITKQKTILRLNSESKQKNVLTAKQLNCDFLQTYYPEINCIRSPILFSGTKKIFLLAQPNGDIYYWNSLTQLIKHQQSYSLLAGHSSPICELVFNENGFISSGTDDGQIIIWSNHQVVCQIEEDENVDQQQISYIDKTKQKVKFTDESSVQINKIREQPSNLKLISQCYMEELTVLDRFTCDKLPLKDSQIDVIVRDGDLYKDIAKSINHILVPNNLEVFQPLIERKKKKLVDMEMSKKRSQKMLQIRQRVSLNLSNCFIYGFTSEKTRHSLFYIHSYHEKKQNGPQIAKPEPVLSQRQKQIQFSKQLLLPINETHNNCKRGFLYFTGRVGVIWSPILRSQFQYDFHSNRITCAAVHPKKNLICTAEISNSFPIVHVWSADSMTLIHDFKTRHHKFVSKIEFSRDGDFIVTLGGPPFQQSIQIYNWVREEAICFRCIEDSCFYDIKFNPYDYNQIAVCGVKSLCIMKVSNRTLIKKEAACVQSNEEITCMAYTSSIYGNNIESDIITGNSNGDISLFICGKYIVCKKLAHEKSINCLKLCELFKYKTIVISAGEDNMIKFWDTKFNQIASFNVKEALNLAKSFNQSIKTSIAPQSIDLYQCLGDKDNDNLEEDNKQKTQRMNSQAILLVGTRNGSIFQVKISNQYQGLKFFVAQGNHQSKANDLGNLLSFVTQMEKTPSSESQSKMGEKLQLNYVSHFSSLPSTFNRSAMFDIKGNLMIMYSKVAQFFTLWNIEKRQMLKIHKLNSYPSYIKFSKTCFIGICYLDGRVQFLEIDNSLQLLLREERIFFDWDYQPINITFADNDCKVAVVFSKEPQQKRLSSNANASIIEENSPSQGEQIIMIYERVFSQVQGTPFNSTEKNTHCISSQKRKFKNIFWCDFSSGGNKILICYTLNYYLKLNNSNRKRMMSSFQTNRYQPLYEFILYDIVRRMEKDLTNQQFNILNFSPAIRAKYNYYTDCKIVEEYTNHSEFYDQISQAENKKKSGQNSQPKKLARYPSNNSQLHSEISHPSRLAPELVINPSISNQVTEEFVPICQMAQYQKLTLMGTIYGEVLAVSSENFYFDSTEDFSDSMQKCVKAKCFALYDTPISSMQVVGNKLYISAKDCGTITEYSLSTDEQGDGLEDETDRKNQLIPNASDKNETYYEVFTAEKIENWLKYVFPKRKNFYETKLNCQDKKALNYSDFDTVESSKKDEIYLEPYRIIGRNAFYKRNNVLIDLKENLITFSGCNLLIMTGHSDNGYRSQQEFLKLDNSIFSVNPEISTITLSEDKRTLFAGTTEQNCQVIIWDISTRTELEHISFKGYVSVLLIKVSEKQRHAVVILLNKKAEQVIYFLNLLNFEILATFCISTETYICDVAFFPGNQFKFLACGVNYMTQWTFKGGLLNCQNYSMKKSQDLSELNKKSNKERVTFFSIIFVKDVAITSGSDGYLYMWKDRVLLKKQNANPKAAILALFASKNSKIFASGAVDGKANIWQLGSSSIIQKVYQFSIYSGKETIIPSKYHIQSVNIGTNEIFIGTRSGEIYRYEFASNEGNEFEQNYNNKQSHSLILSSFDNDRVNSCSFNISSQKLYLLTQSGIFSVFNLKNNDKIKEEKIKVDNQEIVKMLVCKLSCKIYIIMKKGIDVYTYIEEGKYSNRFNKQKQSLRSGNTEIKAGILSPNQKYLALLMSPNHLQNAKIELYDMSLHDGKEFYVQYKVLENIPANIQIIDFSTDNGYLVYKSSDEDQTIIDLTTKSQIYSKQIEFELEWNEQAKKTSKYIRDICSTYSDENKLKSVIQIMNHSVIAADEMGSLRIFRYEQNFEDNLIEYYRIYLEHLNNVYLCIISADCSVLVTVGWQDRSIILWKVKNFDLNTPLLNKKKSKALNLAST